jgi:ribosomal-protein-alanine N-acetyltransferase
VVAHDSLRRCRFRTRRLVVGEWHELSDRYQLDLLEVVGDILTPTTTAELPPHWQGAYPRERAAAWIEARDDVSPSLLVVEHRTARAIGMLILFETTAEHEAGQTEIRVGYVLAESAWGRGIASELVGGLAAWGRSRPSIASMAAGVADHHHASARVLVKNGFRQIGVRDGERTYRLALDT